MKKDEMAKDKKSKKTKKDEDRQDKSDMKKDDNMKHDDSMKRLALPLIFQVRTPGSPPGYPNSIPPQNQQQINLNLALLNWRILSASSVVWVRGRAFSFRYCFIQRTQGA